MKSRRPPFPTPRAAARPMLVVIPGRRQALDAVLVFIVMIPLSAVGLVGAEPGELLTDLGRFLSDLGPLLFFVAAAVAGYASMRSRRLEVTVNGLESLLGFGRAQRLPWFEIEALTMRRGIFIGYRAFAQRHDGSEVPLAAPYLLPFASKSSRDRFAAELQEIAAVGQTLAGRPLHPGASA
jgi:hypothetical protein